LFTVVWIVDVVWWWVNPLSRSCRSRWLGGLINGFMAFIVFNATLVYVSPEWRLAYGVVFGVPIAFGVILRTVKPLNCDEKSG
jgi:hypothetical protein